MGGINIGKFLKWLRNEVKPVVDVAADMTPTQVIDKIPWGKFTADLIEKGVPQDVAVEYVTAVRDFALREVGSW